MEVEVVTGTLTFKFATTEYVVAANFFLLENIPRPLLDEEGDVLTYVTELVDIFMEVAAALTTAC